MINPYFKIILNGTYYNTTNNQFKTDIMIRIGHELHIQKIEPIFERYIYVFEDFEIQRLMINQTTSIKRQVGSEKFYLVKYRDLKKNEEKITLIEYDRLKNHTGKKIILGKTICQEFKLSKTYSNLIFDTLKNYPIDELKINDEKIVYSSKQKIQLIKVNEFEFVETIDKKNFIILIENTDTNELKISCIEKSCFYDVLNRHRKYKQYINARFNIKF